MTSFKKAKDAKKLLVENNNIVCRTNRASLDGALAFLKDAFGYSSIPEDLHARSSRFGQDIFEGAERIRVCALMHENGDLVLELLDDHAKADSIKMSANEFWIMDNNDAVPAGCDAHYFSSSTEGPHILMREEMKIIHPTVHNTIVWNANRLQEISASRKALFEDIKKTGASMLKGPKS